MAGIGEDFTGKPGDVAVHARNRILEAADDAELPLEKVAIDVPKLLAAGAGRSTRKRAPGRTSASFILDPSQGEGKGQGRRNGARAKVRGKGDVSDVRGKAEGKGQRRWRGKARTKLSSWRAHEEIAKGLVFGPRPFTHAHALPRANALALSHALSHALPRLVPFLKPFPCPYSTKRW